MEITYLGMSCVRLRGRETQVVIDPPEEALPGLSRVKPEVVVRTEGRADPQRLRPAPGRSQEIAGAGEFEVRGITVRGIQSAAGRSIVRVEVDDVRVVSVGRLDRQLTEDELDAIGRVDVLVVPVGGGDALNAASATKLVNAVEPAVVIPVRYRSSSAAGSGSYEPVDTFAKEMGLADGAWESQPKLNLSGALAGEETRVVILEPRAA